MAADEVVVAQNGPELGEVVVRGRLVSHQGETLAGFQQTTRLRSGSRILELLVELDPQRPLDADPWDSYYAARFAWPDPSAELYRDVNAAAVRTELVQFESPHFVEVRADKRRTTLLGGGLPWHCRRGGRKLDTLLIVSGETCRRFRLGLALDLPNPLVGGPGVPRPCNDRLRGLAAARRRLALSPRRSQRRGQRVGGDSRRYSRAVVGERGPANHGESSRLASHPIRVEDRPRHGGRRRIAGRRGSDFRRSAAV